MARMAGRGSYIPMSTQFEGKSQWIWTSGSYDQDRASVIFFRKELVLEEDVKSAVFKISADSRYRLYINGVSAAQGPCKGDRHVWYYDEVDLSRELRRGINVFAIVVLRYPPEHDEGNHSVWRTEMPGLYLDGTILLQNEHRLSFGADRNCKSHTRHREVPGQRGELLPTS